MTAPRSIRVRRAALAAGQAGLGALLIGGVAWAATQPAVTERVADVDVARAVPTGDVPGSTTVALERTGLVCPGPELVGLVGAREFVLDTSGTVVRAPIEALGDIPRPEGPGALALTPLSSSETSEQADAAVADDPNGETADVLTSVIADATAYLALGSGAAAPGLVATQETVAATDEVGGLASVPCQSPQPSAWVLGGGGGPGRAERLILGNPGSNPVTVDVTAYGALGATAPPDGQQVVVPARGRTVILGDALAPDEGQPAFQVTATGGDVTAVLVETSLSGTLPTGFDAIPAAAEPSEEQVVPGVEVPVQGAGTLIVRVLNPGETEAIGTVAALTATGERPIPEAVVRVPAGSVVDVPIEGLPPGPTTLAIAADSPVVAAARTFVNDRGVDAGWAVSQAALTKVGGAALPARDGVQRTLVVSSHGGGGTVEITQVSEDEVTTSEVLVPTDGTVTVPLTGHGVWMHQIDGEGAVHGAVLSTAADDSAAGISSMPLTVPATSARRSEVVPLG